MYLDITKKCQHMTEIKKIAYDECETDRRGQNLCVRYAG